jgi:mevalonate kinase
MGSGIGHAKAILFGEHFVVHGLPAIGAGLSLSTTVEIKRSDSMKFISPYADARFRKSAQAIMQKMGVRGNFEITVKSEIPPGSGLGSSAACSVALASAISDEYGLHLQWKDISKFAYFGEMVQHGRPSGIDNALAAAGGVLQFRKTQNGLEYSRLKVGTPLHIAIAHSGKRTARVSDIISRADGVIRGKSHISEGMLTSAREIVREAGRALHDGDAKTLGELMNINHGLLSALGVTNMDNEKAVHRMRSLGALGAKMTGAGLGGCVIALAGGKAGANRIAAGMRKMGYRCFCAEIGKTENK